MHDKYNNPVMPEWPADTVGQRAKNCVGLLMHEGVITQKEAMNLLTRLADRFGSGVVNNGVIIRK